MYPRLRIYGTVRPIIDEAARIMGVNPYPRRDHGKLVGWYTSVSHKKALLVLKRIEPYLTDPSKKCRARRILDRFGRVGTVHGGMRTAEFFKDCPPPTRIRQTVNVFNRQNGRSILARWGSQDHPGGLIS